MKLWQRAVKVGIGYMWKCRMQNTESNMQNGHCGNLMRVRVSLRVRVRVILQCYSAYYFPHSACRLFANYPQPAKVTVPLGRLPYWSSPKMPNFSEIRVSTRKTHKKEGNRYTGQRTTGRTATEGQK